MTILYILLSFILGLVVGRVILKKNTLPTFKDPVFREEASEKGRQAIQARIERRKARIVSRAEKVGKVDNDDVEDLFCISDATARRYINELVDENKLKRVGTVGKGVYYIPTATHLES